MQVQKSVPEFLLTDASRNSDDRKRLLSDLQLGVLWLYTNGDKPFDRDEALRLQSELRAQHQAEERKRHETRLKQLKTTEKESRKLHRQIAELVFRVQVLGSEVNAGEIGWNTQIRDKITGVRVGTPRTLLNQHVSLDWRTDVHASVNLEQYLRGLKIKYDGFSYPFAFERARLPFERASRYLTFKIRLVWKSISVGSRTRKKLAALLSKYKKR